MNHKNLWGKKIEKKINRFKQIIAFFTNLITFSFVRKKKVIKLQRHRVRRRERERGFTETRRRSWSFFTFGDEQKSTYLSLSLMWYTAKRTEKKRERERERERVRVRAHINKWKVDNQTTKVLRASQQLRHNLCHFIVLNIYFIILPYYFIISHLSDVL